MSNPDATVQNGKCYRYRLAESDRVGNTSAWSAASGTAKVDLQNPGAPSLSFGSFTNAYASGSTVYYRPGVAGQFTVTASGSDAESGVGSYSFPTFWTTSGSGASRTYSWTGTPAAPGTQSVAVVDGAGRTGAGASFTPTADSTAPSTTDDTGSIGNGWKNTNQTVTLTPTDAGSGVSTTYYTTDGSTPTTGSSSGTSVVLSSDGTFTVKYFSLDRVGNAESVQTAGTQIRIDKTQPSTATLTALPASIRNGQALTATAADATSGVASVAYLYCAGGSCTPSTSIGSSSTGPSYSVTWSSQPADGTYQVARARDRQRRQHASTRPSRRSRSTTRRRRRRSRRSRPPSPRPRARASPSPRPDGTATFQCQLDGGAYSACTSPKSYAGLADGSHTFDVHAVDPAGNQSAVQTWTWTVDTVAPSISLDSNPPALSTNASPSFTFSSTDGTATFECKLDGGAFAACTSPKSYCGPRRRLAHLHRPRRRSRREHERRRDVDLDDRHDRAGRLDHCEAGRDSPTASPSFSFSSTDGTATFECKLDAGSFAACTSPKSYSGLCRRLAHLRRPLASTRPETTSADATWTWTVDTVAPTDDGQRRPGRPDERDERDLHLLRGRDGHRLPVLPRRRRLTRLHDGDTFSGLAEGAHSFQARGDRRPRRQRRRRVGGRQLDGRHDRADDDDRLESVRSDERRRGATFSFSAERVGHRLPVLARRRRATRPAPRRRATAAPPRARTPSSSRRPQTTPATRARAPRTAWTVDTTAPTTTISAQPPTRPTRPPRASPSRRASRSPASPAGSTAAPTPAAPSAPRATRGLTEGSHTFDVKANADDAGNPGTVASATWTIDTTAPTVSILTDPGAVTNATAASFTFSASESVTGMQCSLDGGAYADCSARQRLLQRARRGRAHLRRSRRPRTTAGNAGSATLVRLDGRH